MHPSSCSTRSNSANLPLPTQRAVTGESQPVAVSVAEAARLLGVSERAIYVMRKSPGFPQARLLSPRAPRFLVAELLEWAARQPGANTRHEPPQLARGRIFKSGQLVGTERVR